MIKNRFFKTTSGVAFEFAVCKDSTPAGPSAATSDNSVTFTTALASTQAAGDFYLLRQNPTTGQITIARNDGTAAAVFRTGAYKGWPHQFAWCVNGTTKQFYMTAPVVPERCEPIEKIAYAAATAQVTTLATTGIPVNAIQELYFKIIELTPGNIPLPSWGYNKNLSTSVSEGAAWTAIAAEINLAKQGEFFTAVAGATGITITSTDASRTFKLVFSLNPTRTDPNDYGVSYTATTSTPAFPGNGTQAMVEDLYKEALVRQGVGHFYTPAGVTAAEFGIPDTLATTLGGSNNFTIYKISCVRSEASKTPHTVTLAKIYIFIAVPTAHETAFELLFGGASYNA